MVKKQVKVKPNSQQQKITKTDDGCLTIALTSPPVDGKANQELIKILAQEFNVSKSKVTIISGFNSRHKWVEIDLE